MSTRALEREELQLLRALATDAAGGRRWSWRGVRGWRFTDEFSDAFVFVAEQLIKLAGRGYVRRDDVLDPARTTPLYLNHVTVGGAEYLGQIGAAVASPIEDPGKLTAADSETLFISRAAWEGLAVLGGVEADDGWLPAIEIGNRIATTFVRNDAEILISRGLSERRPTADPSRATRGEQQYRATALGRGARLLDGKTSETRVQVRVPGLVLRQPVPMRRGIGPVSGG